MLHVPRLLIGNTSMVVVNFKYAHSLKDIHALNNLSLLFHEHRLKCNFFLSKTETRLQSYSDPNVTHATNSDEQTIQYKSGNKKPPYWLIYAPPVPPRMKIYSLETKITENNEGKTESGKYGKHSK